MVKVTRESLESMTKLWDQPITHTNEGEEEPPLISEEPPLKRIKREEADAPIKIKLKTVKDRDIEAQGFGIAKPRASLPPSRVKIILNDNKIPAPSKKLTDLDEHVTTVCANLSQQIYDARDKSYFQFGEENSSKVKVIGFDNHDTLDPAIPAFAIVQVDDKLILGWRGSHNALDFVTDIAISPVISPGWGKAGSGMRGQGMYCALVASDVAKHEKMITDYIKDRSNKVNEVILTGHSLGGGMANIAHVLIRAKLDYSDRCSYWSGLKNRITCRTLAFEPPMTMLDYDEIDVDNIYSDELLKKVAANTRTIIYGCDVVPRGYAHVSYIHDVIKEVLPEFFRDKLPLVVRLGSGQLSKWIIGKIISNLKEVTEVAAQFRHLGTILYYPDDDAVVPMEITDVGPEESRDPTHLSYYTYKSYNVERNDHVDSLYDAHLHFPERLASHISVDSDKN